MHYLIFYLYLFIKNFNSLKNIFYRFTYLLHLSQGYFHELIHINRFKKKFVKDGKQNVVKDGKQKNNSKYSILFFINYLTCV